MPGVLFLPDLFYDYRIWADLPDRLGADCGAVCYDVHELAEISVPVSVVSARRAGRVGRAIAGMAPEGRFIAATADTDLVWLEDRIQAKAAIGDMLGRLPA